MQHIKQYTRRNQNLRPLYDKGQLVGYYLKPPERIITEFALEAHPIKFGNKLAYRLGGTTQGHSVILLGSHYHHLRKLADNLGKRLLEEHIKDEVIETILHENLHATLDVIEEEGLEQGSIAEEIIVNTITNEAMDNIRHRKKLGDKMASVEIGKLYRERIRNREKP